MFLLATRRWRRLQGGTSATQRQKFHTDDVNQCLQNKSGSHGVLNANVFFFLRFIALYLSVNAFSTKVLIGDTIF